jgi:uncharacterized membrane protein YkgB
MAVSKIDTRIARLDEVGHSVLRYSVVFLLLFFGAAKFTAGEAAGVVPFVSHSPVLSWLLALLGPQGASDVIGVVEVATGLAIATRRFAPAISAAGSLAATGTFLVTVSFLFTTPGALSPMNPAFGFLVKDLVLLGASLVTAAEAARAATRRAPLHTAASQEAA